MENNKEVQDTLFGYDKSEEPKWIKIFEKILEKKVNFRDKNEILLGDIKRNLDDYGRK